MVFRAESPELDVSYFMNWNAPYLLYELGQDP